MPGYWWECDSCHAKRTFKDVTGKGPVVFMLVAARMGPLWRAQLGQRRQGLKATSQGTTFGRVISEPKPLCFTRISAPPWGPLALRGAREYS